MLQSSVSCSASAAILRATGYRAEEMIGREPDFLAAGRFDSEAQRKLLQTVADHGAWQGEYWLKRKNGSETPQWLMINTVRDDQGEPSHTIALFVDIEERKAQEEKIRHLSHHDTLIGLPNRLLFDERLKMSLQQAERHQEQVALLFIDLDRFKNINDTLGHQAGDGLLRPVAQRLLDAVRAGDTVCRQGGDEFVVILNAVADAQEVAQVVEHRLIPLILQPHSVGDVTLHISCSIGIALYPGDGQQPVRANVRVIAATHQNLEDRVREGLFREDLFHRLNVIRLRLPPLRERRDDIPVLARHFLAKSAQEIGGEPKRLTDPALKFLQTLDFPSNVRQLENICHWLTVMAPGQNVDLADLPAELRDEPRSAAALDWIGALAGEADRLLALRPGRVFEELSRVFESTLIRRALAASGGRRIDAAQLLGIGRNTITRKIQEMGLDEAKTSSDRD